MDKKDIFLGLDPGAKGAVAVLDEQGNLISVTDLPRVGKEYNLRELNRLIRDAGACYARLEHQQPFGKEGVNTAFSTGFGFGILCMSLEANNIPYEPVRSQEWKKMFGLITKDKAASVRVAQKLFPNGEFIGPRGGLYDGRAESALIAEFGRRKRLGVTSSGSNHFD